MLLANLSRGMCKGKMLTFVWMEQVLELPLSDKWQLEKCQKQTESLVVKARVYRRVEVLCHDINVHVPHHVSPKIPWYNLRKATDSLRENWGQVILAKRICVH